MNLKALYRRWRVNPNTAVFLCGYWLTDKGLFDKDWRKISFDVFEVTVTSKTSQGFDYAMRAENLKVQDAGKLAKE